MPRKFSPPQIDNAVQLYASGKTLAQVETETGVGIMTVYRAAKRAGVETSNATAVEQVDAAVSLYRSGKTLQQVEAETGVARSVISRALKGRGAPTRGNRRTLPAQEIAGAYLEGESEASLARRHGVARLVIRRHLDEAGIQIRSVKEASILHMSQTTTEQRAEMTRAAHEAARGRTASAEELELRAQHRERTLSHASEREFQFGHQFTSLGASFTPQKAVGPYNVDFAIGSVAVEVLGGAWHAYKPEHAERTPYILNAGWNLLFIWDLKKAPLCVEAADYAIAYAKQASRNPSLVGEYRVIRGDAQLMASGGVDEDHFTLVLPSIANFGGRPID